MELKLKIIPDMSEVVKAFAKLGILKVQVVGGTGGTARQAKVSLDDKISDAIVNGTGKDIDKALKNAGMEVENKKQSSLLQNITAGVFAGNVMLKTIEVIMDALDPILRPIMMMIKILLFIIFLPLLPFMKVAFKALAGLVKFASGIMKTPEGQATGPLISILAGIGGALGGVAGAAIGTMILGPIGTILGAGLGTLIGTIVGGIAGMLAVALGILIAETIKFLAKLDWFKIITKIIEALGGVWDMLIDLLGQIIGGFREAVDAMEPGPLKNALDFIVSIFELIGKVYEDFFGTEEEQQAKQLTLWDRIGNALDDVANWMGVGGVWDLIKSGIEGAAKFLFGEPESNYPLVDKEGKLTGIGTKPKVKGVFDFFMEGMKLFSDAMFGADGQGGVMKRIMNALEDFKNFIIPWVDAIILPFKIFGEIILALLKIFGIDLEKERQKYAGTYSDFIMRPGQAPVSFSPDDTIVGSKGGMGGGGGVTYSPTFNISPDVDGSALRRMIQDENRKFLDRLRSMGTAGGRIFNV